MSLQPIDVTLSSFECLSILREELQLLERERSEIEVRIRESKEILARQEYLGSISAYFGTRPVEEPPEDAVALEQQRALIHEAFVLIEQQIPLLEGEASKSGAAGDSG